MGKRKTAKVADMRRVRQIGNAPQMSLQLTEELRRVWLTQLKTEINNN